MDSVLPFDFPVETALRRSIALGARAKRKAADLLFDPRLPMTAVSGGKRYGVVRFGTSEIVVESEGRAPMRGIVDLFAGGERVGRLLVQLAWQRDGRSGYELKRRSLLLPSGATPHGAR
ncbi:MAG: hypothetical protein AAFS07_09290 [Pseudomonadota bacterium]